MPTTGTLTKMRVTPTSPVTYELLLGEQVIHLNPIIGQPIRLEHTGQINCIHCGRKTAKSFNQGYCYPCFTRLAQCDSCIVRPELCHYDQGTCREPEWGEQHCMQPHYVYLANSSGLKVGITRHTQLPTRWIDQGATEALPIFQVPNRRMSGLVEVAFAKHIADKTQWQKMLKGEAESLDLSAKRDELLPILATELAALQAELGIESLQPVSAEQTTLSYPVNQYPSKVTALNFDKNPIVEGTLQGIKGQYLILDTGVLNVRKFGGYQVTLTSEALD